MSNERVQVEIFLPTGVCGCSFSHWIDRVYNIIMNYSDKVQHKSLTTDSERASELGINSMCVTVNERIVSVKELDKVLRMAIESSTIN
ncbi:MAG: hypothetical protein ACXAEU_24705 [Candidatus Hodarchaeales archaeon]